VSLTNDQKARFLERWATLIHTDPDAEGFSEQAEALGADLGSCEKFAHEERDRLLRRAAKLRGGEASTLTETIR
jgi:hypothetical protein